MPPEDTWWFCIVHWSGWYITARLSHCHRRFKRQWWTGCTQCIRSIGFLKKKNDKNIFSNGLYQIDHFHFVSPKLSSFYGNNFDSFQTLLYPVLARIQVAAHRVHVLGLGSGSQRCCRPNLFRNLDDRSMCSAHVEESDHFEAWQWNNAADDLARKKWELLSECHMTVTLKFE